MHYLKNIPLKNSFEGTAVLISGGTRGIGKAIGLAFGVLGAQVHLTHRWGSADENELHDLYESLGALKPKIFEADASILDENVRVVTSIIESGMPVIAFVSCVCAVVKGNGLDGMSYKSIKRSLAYSSWPCFEIAGEIRKMTGKYPRYTLTISSDGHLSHYPGYDNVAICKAALEAAVKVKAEEFAADGARINVIRTRNVLTEGFREIFGEYEQPLLKLYTKFMIVPEKVANLAVALCSGYMDCLNGQVIVLDKGSRIMDNVFTMAPVLMEGSGNA